MRHLFAAAALAATLTPVCHALDLAEVYDLALKNDPQWSATTNSFKAENEKEAQSRGALLPVVSLTANLTQNHFDPNNGATQNYSGNQQALQVRQPLFRVDLWRDYQRAKTATSLNEANYRQKENEQVLRVSQAYIEVLRAQENLATAQAEEAALKRQLEQARKRFEVGLIARTDVLEAQAQLDSAIANRISLETALASSRENLGAITGSTPEQLSALRADFEVTAPQPADPAAWVQLSKEKNPQLAAARLTEKTAQEARYQQRSAYFPQVDLVGSLSRNENNTSNASLSFNNGQRMSAGIEMQWPLYVGGRTGSAVRQATFQADAARDQADAVERQLTAQTRSAFLNVSADSYRVGARKQAVLSNEAALSATRAGYDVGTRNIVDVLLAERNLYAARRDYANARYDYVINTLKLRAASGQLSAIDIRELNGWLQK